MTREEFFEIAKVNPCLTQERTEALWSHHKEFLIQSTRERIKGLLEQIYQEVLEEAAQEIRENLA